MIKFKKTTSKSFMFLVSVVLLIAIGKSTFAQQTIQNDSIYLIQDSILIPTKSGVPISAIIVRKKSNTKPLPAVLFYTTYYQNASDAIFGKKSADRDYVGVVAYTRGIKTDLKNYKPFENEGKDIYEIID